MAKKEHILELLNAYKSEVDNFNDAIFTDTFEALAQDIVKLFAIPVVVGRSEQLVAFLKWVGDGYDFENNAEKIVKEYIDEGN